MKVKKLPVSLVEQGVFHYPKGMEGWRNFRIEYGGHAEKCIVEGVIWLPPQISADTVELAFLVAQESSDVYIPDRK